jgi:hypothetical protein
MCETLSLISGTSGRKKKSKAKQNLRQEDQEFKASRAPVAHAYNLSYSGGRDQEDHGLRPAQENSLRDPISKIPNTKGLAKWLKW